VRAVIDRNRMKEMADVPTIAQAGVDIPPLVFWGGYAVHANTPPAIVQRLRTELAAAATSASVRESIAAFGVSPAISATSQDFRKLISDDIVWMTEIAKDLNIAPEKS
jgi:tripartite-type tricarboxylate transporter receptor subunit TctC